MIEELIAALKPEARRGALPTVTTCPYCGICMSQTSHAAHRPKCQEEHRFAPPQSARLDDDAGSGYNTDGMYPQT